MRGYGITIPNLSFSFLPLSASSNHPSYLSSESSCSAHMPLPYCDYILYFRSHVGANSHIPARSVSQNSAANFVLSYSGSKKSCPSSMLEHLTYAFARLGGTFEILLGANLLGHSDSFFRSDRSLA